MNFVCYIYNNRDNIIGGVIASIVFFLLGYIIKKTKQFFVKRNIKKIFGFNCWDEEYCLVGGKLHADPRMLTILGKASYVFTKPGGTTCFTQSYVMPYSEIIAADYVKMLIMKDLNAKCHLVFDEDLREPRSYCSFGGYNNNLSIAILHNSKNKFFDVLFGQNGRPFIRNKKEPQKAFSTEQDFDYGVIVKITSDEGYAQICVVGLGEKGTQGGAYYLSKNYKVLAKKFGEKDFGCVIKVSAHQFSSVELVDSLA